MTYKQMRELFAILEQQRVSNDAVENLGKPSEEKRLNILRDRYAKQEAKKAQQYRKPPPPPRK